MNKKGFLKILEAIVAVLIVLGFIVAIIPEKPPQQAKLPPDLEQITKTILKELQETPEFRACVLEIGYTGYNDVGGTGAECVYNFIKFITEPRALHPWDYAARVCTADVDGITECTFYEQSMSEVSRDNPGEITEQITQLATRVGKNIYIKSITITVEDVLGDGRAGDASRDAADEDGASESNIRPGVQRVITIFAWSKI